jgi:hypothetical protein
MWPDGASYRGEFREGKSLLLHQAGLFVMPELIGCRSQATEKAKARISLVMDRNILANGR